MATRRIKSTLNNHYVQPLKVCSKNPLVFSMSSSYNSVLFTKKHKSCNISSNQDLVVWAKFKSSDFDGINLIAFLNKNNKKATIGSCLFKIYSISNDDSWTETLINQTTINGPTNSAKLHLSEASLTPLELDGEFTISVEVILTIRDKKYNKKIYINHLGVYDSIFRLRQDVEFLDITKVDE
jgi:hypothetical protein